MSFENDYWQYKGLIEIMSEFPGIYGTNERRVKSHKQLEKYFKGKEKELAEVLHSLPKDFSPDDLVKHVNDIDGFKLFIKKWYSEQYEDRLTKRIERAAKIGEEENG